MIETNKEMNSEGKNCPETIYNDSNQNLISTSDEDNNNNKINIIDIKNDNDSNINEDKDDIKSYKNWKKNNIDMKCYEENLIGEKNLEKIESQQDEDSDLFQTSVKSSLPNVDEKDSNDIIENRKLKILLIILKFLFGISLISGSVILLIIIINETVKHQKLIGIIIEPIIILISLLGMFLFKNITYKKILFALFLWEGIYLFPLSFYVKSSIKDDYIFFFDIIIKIRIGLLLGQLINFILALAFKLDI